MLKKEIIGQNDIWDRLMKMVEENRIPHALLFCGPSGCGKMATALAFASYLLGETGEENGNNRNAIAMLRKWEHPDLHFTYPTIKSPKMSSDHQPTSEDYAKEWRQMLAEGPYFQLSDWTIRMAKNEAGEKESNKQAVITVEESNLIFHNMSLKSSMGGYKVSLIWLPERMNVQCANKILKLLEEPPSQSVFILISEAPETLLETIRSRTQRIDFKRIKTEYMEQALIERRGLDNDMAHRIARIANGNWNTALGELDAGNENRQHLDMFIMLMRLAYMRNIHDLKKWSDIVATFSREKQKRMLDYFCRMVRENFMYNFGQPSIIYMTEEEEKFAKNFARFINEANVIDIFNLFDECKRFISQNANAKIVFFDLALKIIMLLIRK